MVEGTPVGPGNEQVMLGPVVSQVQMDRVLGYIEQGKKEGARLIAGGGRIDRPGYFV